MSLLHQETLDKAVALAHARVSRRMESARMVMWGKRRNQTPAGLRRLQSPQDRETWMRFMARQANQEQQGFVQSDIASTVMQHPDVQQAFNDQLAQQQPPDQGAAPNGFSQ